jgi:hypothetical protein
MTDVLEPIGAQKAPQMSYSRISQEDTVCGKLGSIIGRGSTGMDIPDDPLERKKWMMDLLKMYGREFLIFEPEDQPNVFAVPEPEYRDLKSGNLDPRELKSWRYLDFTLKFLQERDGLFGEGGLVSDCPVHKLHPLQGERPEDFSNSFQLTAEGSIKFRCRRSIGCKRSYCSAKTNRTLDLYDLVSLLEGKSLEYARHIISDHYEREHGRKLGYFPKGEESTAARETSDIMRYAVPKKELEKLFSIPMKGHGSAERFVEKALELIRNSPEAEYDGYHSTTADSVLFSKSFDWDQRLREFGPAARLFLWLHWKQAAAGSKLRLTVPEVVQALGASERTVRSHKAVLEEKGYLEVTLSKHNDYLWSTKYNPSSES